jgi:hypothetical protein
MGNFSDSFHDLCDSHKKREMNECVFNLFLICSSISLLLISMCSFLKLMHKCCHNKHHDFYSHDNDDNNYCGCGCSDNINNNNNDNE